MVSHATILKGAALAGGRRGERLPPTIIRLDRPDFVPHLLGELQSADGRARHFPRVRVFGVDGAGHWLHHDRLDVFLDTVRAFLKEP